MPYDFTNFVDHLTFLKIISVYMLVLMSNRDLIVMSCHWSITSLALDLLAPFTWSGAKVTESGG